MIENKLIALITGAGSGIGAEIAKELSQKNIHTIITDKTLIGLRKTEEAILSNKGTCTVAQLDMQDFLGIDRLGFEVFKRWKKLDIMISNAAILGTLGPIHHQNSEEFQEVLKVNAVSNHRLIRSFEALLKKGNNPKAIFLTSSLVANPKPFWGAYSVSKAMLEHIVKIWALENKNNNLSISLIDPGETDTPIRRQAMPGENSKLLRKPQDVAKLILKEIFIDKVYKGNLIKLIF
ncbi:MAG: SDR family NAD(P)-dependent oxidoreductase [Proteobacteria bacterium]|jgi:NAD(P)-dependent dehydrogenase (short-subunit alcohol dehydrogenase family)|nr:SDR family oxidoreductase [Alphaproteobacteria bacterium]MBL6851229.1 SDR family oxidoreductase [Alphaproteobacteria bacterium]MDA0916905.1 SDR family NAD(P)-dependent oxidoreductase [Pseudomonadota bacterium]